MRSVTALLLLSLALLVLVQPALAGKLTGDGRLEQLPTAKSDSVHLHFGSGNGYCSFGHPKWGHPNNNNGLLGSGATQVVPPCAAQ